jgi:hypothetical protein
MGVVHHECAGYFAYGGQPAGREPRMWRHSISQGRKPLDTKPKRTLRSPEGAALRNSHAQTLQISTKRNLIPI